MRTNATLLLISALLIGAGCKDDPSAPPIYRTPDEYNARLKEVEQLTKTAFEGVHDGYPLSEREIANLKKADKIIDGLIAFKSDSYGPYILKGLTERALGNRPKALQALQQGLALAPKTPKPDDVAAVARIHQELSSYYAEDQDFANAEVHADMAVKLLPLVPELIANAAGIKVQLKKLDEASKLVDQALKIEPTNQRALDLKKLLSMPSEKH